MRSTGSTTRPASGSRNGSGSASSQRCRSWPKSWCTRPALRAVATAADRRAIVRDPRRLDLASTRGCYKPRMMRSTLEATPAGDIGPARVGKTRAWLFNADGQDQRIDPSGLRLHDLSPRQLAWIDVLADDSDALQPLLRQLEISSLPLPALSAPEDVPLRTWQEWFVVGARAPVAEADSSGSWLLLVGPNAVLTLHRTPLPFLDELFDHDDPDSRLGVLSADSFAASLLDRMLTVYFEAIDAFEDEVDELE